MFKGTDIPKLVIDRNIITNNKNKKMVMWYHLFYKMTKQEEECPFDDMDMSDCYYYNDARYCQDLVNELNPASGDRYNLHTIADLIDMFNLKLHYIKKEHDIDWIEIFANNGEWDEKFDDIHHLAVIINMMREQNFKYIWTMSEYM